MMENSAPRPDPPAPPPPEDGPDDAAQKKNEKLAALSERLAARAAAHAAQTQRPAPTPVSAPAPIRFPQLPQLLQELSWNLRLFLRWLRPRLVSLLVLLLAIPLRGLLHLYRHLRRRSAGLRPAERLQQQTRALMRRLRQSAALLRGWSLWQWRELRRNPDRRLAVIGLLGGFLLPLLLIITLAHVMPPPDDPVAAYVDPSVPAPEANFIEALPGEDPGVDAAALTSGPQALTPDNFSFELFVRRGDDGRIQLLSHVAEHYISQWYPKGTPAVQFMRFFGKIMQRASGESDMALAARSRCLSMPTSRIFTERTVTCTYGHALPPPLDTQENPHSRVFWIVALSFDRNNNLTDLRIHARLTYAPTE